MFWCVANLLYINVKALVQKCVGNKLGAKLVGK